MWKVKDGVDLKEFDKFGFGRTGFGVLGRRFYETLTFSNWEIQHFIQIEDRIIKSYEWDTDDFHLWEEEVDEDEIRDLIDAGLVEKVDE